MTLVAFAPTADYRADPGKHEVLRVVDGDPSTSHREWYLDVEHLATHGEVVLDTTTDGPIIAALDDYAGFERIDAGSRGRTLPDDVQRMNRAQVLATVAGNAIKDDHVKDGDPESGLVQDLPLDQLKKRVEKADPVDPARPEGVSADDVIEQAKRGVTKEGVSVGGTGRRSADLAGVYGPSPEGQGARQPEEAAAALEAAVRAGQPKESQPRGGQKGESK